MKKETHNEKAAKSSSATAEAVPDTKHVGERLVSLCRSGKNFDAIDELYDADVISVEAMAPPEMPLKAKGVDEIRKKNKWWFDANTIHATTAEGPLVNADRFAVRFHHEFTPKSAGAKGERMKMDEIALYTVRDGKIVHEAFFA